MKKCLSIVAGLLLIPSVALGNIMMLGGNRTGVVDACPDPGDITSNTKLLIHSNNPDASTNILDSSPSANAVTVYDNSHHSTDYNSFSIGGASSMYFDGAGDYVEAANTENLFGSGDFTISFHIRPTAINASYYIYPMAVWESGGGSDRSWYFRLDLSQNMVFVGADSATTAFISLTSTTTFAINTDYWIVVERSGSNAYMWINGTKEATDSSASGTISSSNHPMAIGCSHANGAAACHVDANEDEFTGYISEVKIDADSLYDGAATITEPTEPYSSTCFPLDGYSNQVKFSVDNTKIDATLTDFPLALLIDSSAGLGTENLQGFLDDVCGSEDVQDDKFNIAITTSDEYTQTYVESVNVFCNAGSGEWGQIHFLAPSVSSSADTDFYLYWDEATLVNSEWVGSVDYNATKSQAVWPDNVMVHHFVGVAETDLDDSSASGNDVSADTGTPDYNQTGSLGYAVNFVGSGEWLTVPDDNSLSFGNASTDSPFSIYSFLNMDDATGCPMFSKGSAGAREYVMSTSGADTWYLIIHDNVDSVQEAKLSSGTLTAYQGDWLSLTGTYDGTGGSTASTGITIYRDDAVETSSASDSGSYTAMHNQAQNAAINSQWLGAGNECNGKQDELYIFDIELSAAQVKTLHNTSSDTLVTYSTPSTDGVPKNLKISNGDVYTDQMSSLTGWTETNQTGNEDSSQTTLQGFEVFKMWADDDVAGNDRTDLSRDVGTFGSRTVATTRWYHDNISTVVAADGFLFELYNGTYVFKIQFGTDGVWIDDNAGYGLSASQINHVCSGADQVNDCWQNWTFDIDWSTTTVDIYVQVDGQQYQLVAEDINMDKASATADGTVIFRQAGYATANRTSYIDFLNIGATFLNE
jgi:hypothetical protein